MIALEEHLNLAAAPSAVWAILTDPALVASCIPGFSLDGTDEIGQYRGTVRMAFGPTVAVFRGEAKVSYVNDQLRCTVDGRGIDQRGASRANAKIEVVVTGEHTSTISIQGTFHVAGPLETFASAGGVHVARALIAEFAENLSRLLKTNGTANNSPEEPRALADAGVPARARVQSLSILGLAWRTLVVWLSAALGKNRSDHHG